MTPVSGQVTTQAFLQSFARRWLAAWNSHDTNEVLDLLHPEIYWEDTVLWPRSIRGIDRVREYVEGIWRAMPDVQFDEVQLFTAPEDGRALVLVNQFGHGPEKIGQRKAFDSYGCGVFLEFIDGKLSRYLAQYEIHEMMRQLGTLSARNESTGEADLYSLLADRTTITRRQ
jgi:ketosteroid isomerase-like protein